MSADITMQDLELEHAELLPGRETLYLWEPYPINPGGHMRCYSRPPVGGCPPPPVGGALAQPNVVACPM